jgi:hypothetical protein
MAWGGGDPTQRASKALVSLSIHSDVTPEKREFASASCPH